MQCADDQCRGAHAASSEPAGRTVPRPYTARDRSTATAAETVEQTRATSKHSGEQCRNYAMTGKGVCRIHGGATPPWRWRTVTRWDSEQGRVVEKRVRVVKSPEQRERERRAKLEHKIAKYRANRESPWTLDHAAMRSIH